MSVCRMALSAVAGLVLMACTSTLVQAQDAAARPDPAQMRQRFMDRIKEQMAASDDEWKVLQPKIEKVSQASREARFGGMFFGGRRGGGNDQTPETPVAKAAAALRQILENKEAKADEILGKLKGLREAREKAREELTAAQKALKEVITQRQEAVLVLMGMME